MTREKRLLRAQAALDHWSKFKYPHPYLHPPDLFNFDPYVNRPYLVPATFIPMMVGGKIEIRNRSTGHAKSEGSDTTEFILGNFLPGGYKKRWNFKHFRTFWVPSVWKQGYSNVEPSFVFSKKQRLNEFIAKETFSPFEIPVNDTTIYFPDAVNVEEVPPNRHYTWDEESRYLDHGGAGSIVVARDPPSVALWENISLTLNEPKIGNMFPLSNLIESIGYYPDFRIVRCYYGNVLQLFGAERNLTRIIRFVHDTDQNFALIGTEHISQAVRFKINLTSLLASLPEVLKKNPILTSDLHWNFFSLKLKESVHFHQQGIESTYDIDWIQKLCYALDYWIRWEHPEDNILKFFKGDPKYQQRILRELIPEEKEIRLRLAGFDIRKRNEIELWLHENGEKIGNIYEEIFDSGKFEGYINTVICETLQRTLKIWSQQFFSVIGEGLIFWQDGNIKDGYLTVYAYDRFQGGSGIAKEFFERLHSVSGKLSVNLNNELKRSVLCDVQIADLVIFDLFLESDPDYLWSVFREPSGAAEEIIRSSLKKQEKIGDFELRPRRIEDLITFIRLEIRRLIPSKENAALYSELIHGYKEIQNHLGRTPQLIDLLIYGSANFFYDPRAIEAFERFRTVKKGDLSEVYARVDEMIPSCVDACPECIDFDEPYGSRLNGSLLLNRRLILALLEGV